MRALRRFVVLPALLCIAVWLVLPIALDAAVDLDKFKVGQTVTITMGNSAKFTGKIVALESDRVRIQLKGGTSWFSSDQIRQMAIEKSAKEKFDEQSKLAKTADDWFKLGNAMEVEEERELAAKAFEEALKVDPNHAETREKRGEVQHEGKWVPLEDAMKAQGKELYKGDWLDPEGLKAAKQREADALKAVKMKSRDEIIREYEGRPYAEVPPILTEHYNIKCDSTEEVGREYAAQLEALFEKYSMVFKSFDPEAKFKALGKAKVWIHKNRQQFLDWTGVPETVGGFYRLGEKDVTAYHGSFGNTGTTYEVLAHEGTHQFQGYIFKNFLAVPYWIIEGLAVFFGDGSEYKGGRVEIGLIPRDRLEGLQRTIESNNYPDLNTLLRTEQPAFSGFFYAPAWGVVYRCLRGDKSKPKAHDGEELEMFATYLDRVARSASDHCEYDEEAKRFIRELTGASKKHNNLTDWENDYKDWIMKLPLEKLMRRGKGADSWKSDKLGFEVRQPAGWSVDKTSRFEDEQIAFIGPGAKHRRISTGTLVNWQQAELSEEVVRSLIPQFFGEPDYEPDGCKEPVLNNNLHGYPAVDTVFIGSPTARQDNTAGAGGVAKEGQGGGERYQYRVIVNASVDKIRVNILEAEPAEFEAADKKFFEKYLAEFKVEN